MLTRFCLDIAKVINQFAAFTSMNFYFVRYILLGILMLLLGLLQSNQISHYVSNHIPLFELMCIQLSILTPEC